MQNKQANVSFAQNINIYTDTHARAHTLAKHTNTNNHSLHDINSTQTQRANVQSTHI